MISLDDITLYVNIIGLVALVGYGIFYTWFDKRIRIVMIHPDKKISISKHNITNGERFNKDNKTYVFDEKAVFIRGTRIPYCIYYYNNPKPILIMQEKTGKTEYHFTGQEISKMLETDFTLKLLTPKVNVKKIAMGIAMLVAVGIVVLVVLHFTGVIDLGQLIQQTLGTAPPPPPT